MSDAAFPSRTAPPSLSPHPAPSIVDVLPYPPVRRWGRIAGLLWHLWSLLAVSVITVVMVTLAFLATPFDRDGRRVWRLTLAWARACLFVSGVRVETYAEAPLPEGPCIFACNHQGTFDILALFVGLKRPFVFVAKKVLFHVPFLGWHLSAQGYIPIDRAHRAAAIRSLDRAAELIRGGRSVVVFPEGTRSADGSVHPFKKGPFMLALQARVPVVPVALEGAHRVQPKRTLYVCPNPVRLLIGPAVPTGETADGMAEGHRDELMRRVRSTIIRLHRRLGGAGGDESNAIAASGVEGLGRPSRRDAAGGTT